MPSVLQAIQSFNAKDFSFAYILPFWGPNVDLEFFRDFRMEKRAMIVYLVELHPILVAPYQQQANSMAKTSGQMKQPN